MDKKLWQVRRATLRPIWELLQDSKPPTHVSLSLCSVDHISLSVYASSVDQGFSLEQVKFIWGQASQHYSQDELWRLFFAASRNIKYLKGILECYEMRRSFDSTDRMCLGEAGNVLRQVKCEHDRRTQILDIEEYFKAPMAPWAGFTIMLLEKLNQDDLATEALSCLLLELQLGL